MSYFFLYIHEREKRKMNYYYNYNKFCEKSQNMERAGEPKRKS